MSEDKQDIDWSVTTWEGSRRAQLRHALTLTVRERLEAAEGLADVGRRFQQIRARGGFRPATPEPEAAQAEAPPAAREPAGRYGSSEGWHDVALHGCTPEPLMNYLKSLGVLRLVNEQADPLARGYWGDGVFRLVSTLSSDALLEFFLRRYQPTPIVVPWSGSDFFDVDRSAAKKTYDKTPTGARVIEAFLGAEKELRLDEYQRAIDAALGAMKKLGIRKKEQLGKPDVKAAYLVGLRNLAGSKVADWIDAAAVIGNEKATFSSLLGSGGGSDGNTHFSDNFMQNLWEVLPEFDRQRGKSGKAKSNHVNESSEKQLSLGLLRSALFGEAVRDLAEKRTSSLFDSGAVGGPNATQGMERESLTNPWNFILGLEGALLFAGTVAKRAGSVITGTSFPFQFQFSSTDGDRAALKEQAGREIWFPLWEKPATLAEVRVLFGEGRAEIGPRAAVRGVDMARAASSLGVDRGIGAFQRYAIVKGRVGGDNYNTAVSLGRFNVRFRQTVNLLVDADLWLDRFRRACRIGQKDEAPARLVSALRRIDGAVFDYCRYGGARHFQSILVALGQTERESMRDGAWATKNRVPPLAGLSLEWIVAANDGSIEFEIALALASMHDAEFKLGSLRTNLEPVVVAKKADGSVFAKWAEKDRAVVWNAGDLASNMSAVLARRVMDANRAGCERLPIGSRHAAALEAVAAFIAGEVDDSRVKDLVWGLMLVDANNPMGLPRRDGQIEAQPLPRTYALLKLLFLPRPLVADRGGDGQLRWRYSRQDERGIELRPEPTIVPLLRANRIPEACEIAMRRVRASGLVPMPDRAMGSHRLGRDWGAPGDVRKGERLAAALLLPIDSSSVGRLVSLVIRQTGSTDVEIFDYEEETA